MSAKIVRLHDHRHAPLPDGEGDQETIRSILARRRHALGYPEPGKRRLGNVAMRRALNVLQSDATTIESCMIWLRDIVGRDHDPRAIAALIDRYDWNQFDRTELLAIQTLLGTVLIEYAKALPKGA